MNKPDTTPPERVTEFVSRVSDERQKIAEYLMREHLLPDIECAYDIISEIEWQVINEAFGTDNEIDFEYFSILAKEYGIPDEYVNYFITTYIITIL